jgi:iron(II)-dependent oxidoreductase
MAPRGTQGLDDAAELAMTISARIARTRMVGLCGWVIGMLLLMTAAHADEIRIVGSWKFQTDPSGMGLSRGFAKVAFNDQAWADVHAGVSWSAAGFEDYSGSAWYRKTLSIPRRFRGKFLVFYGVAEHCVLYLNGIEVTRHDPPADPRRVSRTPGATPFRVRLPDRDFISVALQVTATDRHEPDSFGPGLVGNVALSSEPLVMTAGPSGYWMPPDAFVTHDEWMTALRDQRRERRRQLGVDNRIYTGEFAWITRNFTQAVAFVYDSSFYDSEHQRYRIDEFLDDGVRRFGGYDSIQLWHAYPNIGIDSQNQFEMLRDLPGGIQGLSRMIERAHARGVKVFIPYNPWDTATRQEVLPHSEALAQIVARLKADGVFLDTTSNSPALALRQAVDAKRLGVALQPESGGGDDGIVTLNSSWNQFGALGGYTDHVRGVPVSKWTEPRHITQADGDRWRHDRTVLIQDAFLNGTGVVVWEDVFGSWNRFTARDAALLRRMLPIQREFANLLVSDDWEPLTPALINGIDVTYWPGGSVSLWTIANWDDAPRSGNILRVKYRLGTRYYDLWNGTEVQPSLEGDEAILSTRIEAHGLGALIALQGNPSPEIVTLLAAERREAATPLANYPDVWMPPRPPILKQADKIEPIPIEPPPENMALIPASKKPIRISIEHNLGEAGCYPDNGSDPWEGRAYFMYERGDHQRNVLHQSIPPSIPGFFMDKTTVTQREYHRFLEATAYRPTDTARFLEDWDWSDPLHPKPQAGRENHPVVWVDLDDARAYLHWIGKRLPTENEWQYAAGGVEQRRYPWGDAWQPGVVNDAGTDTTAVNAFPEGRTPEGLYDMSGNVWQWTDSERNDGNRYVLLRGGSFYQVGGSSWYFDRFTDFGLSKGERSARPTNYHVKLFLMSPGMDRKATIGFRGVRDVEQSSAKIVH